MKMTADIGVGHRLYIWDCAKILPDRVFYASTVTHEMVEFTQPAPPDTPPASERWKRENRGPFGPRTVSRTAKLAPTECR